jgi:hypothetical protein
MLYIPGTVYKRRKNIQRFLKSWKWCYTNTIRVYESTFLKYCIFIEKINRKGDFSQNLPEVKFVHKNTV